MSEIDVSIVMTYFERKKQLINTIKSFAMHKYEGVEVIIVDDASLEEPISAEELLNFAPLLRINVIKLERSKKNYVNPCIPFNVGLAAARGRLIIIQNAECIHLDNVVAYCRNNIDESRYLSFGCFSIDKNAMLQITNREIIDKEFLGQFIAHDSTSYLCGENGWYNHSIHKPQGYHFASAITKNNLERLRGFDTRYASGIGFDDDEILERIRRLLLKIEIIDSAIVLHQWHYRTPNKRSLFNTFKSILQYKRNGYLFNIVSKKEKGNNYSRYSIRYQIFLLILPLIMIYSALSIFYNFLPIKINKIINKIKG
jgi:GT2 family glycosyltransferase